MAYLKEKHLVTSVGHLETLALCFSPRYRQNKNCPYKHYIEDRSSMACRKPFKCAKLAKDIMKCLLPKWNPQSSSAPYSLNITQEQILMNDNNLAKQNDKIFGPTFHFQDSIQTGYQVFVTPNPPCPTSVRQVQQPPGEAPQLITISITGIYIVNKDGDLDNPDKELMIVLVASWRRRCALTTLIGWNTPMPKINSEGATSLAKSGINKT